MSADGVELQPETTQDILRMLIALSTILRSSPFPDGHLYDLLEPVIGAEIIRWPDPIAGQDLALKAEELSSDLRRALGDRLTDDRLAARP